MAFRCPQTDFFHGASPMGTSMVAFFYFEKIDQGMAVVPVSLEGSMAFVRITTCELTGNAWTMRNKGPPVA
jgi:hypothetical protein